MFSTIYADAGWVGGSEKIQIRADVIQGWSLSKYWDIGFCVSRFSLPTQFQFPPRRFCPLWSKEPLGVRVLLCKQIKLQPTSLLPGTLALPAQRAVPVARLARASLGQGVKNAIRQKCRQRTTTHLEQNPLPLFSHSIENRLLFCICIHFINFPYGQVRWP